MKNIENLLMTLEQEECGVTGDHVSLTYVSDESLWVARLVDRKGCQLYHQVDGNTCLYASDPKAISALTKLDELVGKKLA